MIGPFLQLTRRVAVVLVGLTVFAGCETSKPPAATKLSEAERQLIYQRAWQPLNRVDLWKPDPKGHDETAVYWAPLFLLQPSQTKEQMAGIDTVWTFTNSVVLLGKAHSQQTFVWNSAAGKLGKARLQAIRVTFDSESRPAIFETLHDSSGGELIWISQALEIAAAEQFGSPNPGRLCSAERSFSDAPQTIVPAIVDDGPMPMGPMLYVNSEGDVPIVACRCSSIQAQTLDERGFYRLNSVPVESARAELFKRLNSSELQDWFDPLRLEKRLRLPDHF